MSNEPQPDEPTHRCMSLLRRVVSPHGNYWACWHCGLEQPRDVRYVDELNKPDTPLETWIRKNL